MDIKKTAKCFSSSLPNNHNVAVIPGLPLFELTTPANVPDSVVALDILAQTDAFLPLRDCTFIADKGYDARKKLHAVRDRFHGDCVIPLNYRSASAQLYRCLKSVKRIG